MDYKAEYSRWFDKVDDKDLKSELDIMKEDEIKDAFYRDLSFGTGGLRGIIGVGTNRINRYVVAKATQGLSEYLGKGSSVVIGYDSRILSYEFARVTSCVFAANGIDVWLWRELNPVPTVSYAVRKLGASAGVMITASHNPSDYNGYKVYGSDGCQITTQAAAEIFSCISSLDIFSDVIIEDFDRAVAIGIIKYIDDEVMNDYLAEVKNQSVIYGEKIDRDVKIVFSPLNGTGLMPVTRVLKESGFTNITVVKEQMKPDGSFPTCPYPNPEVREAMNLGLEYCYATGAELLLATDPDCDRCGIAVRDGENYRLLTANEVGLLMLDYVCNQKTKHNKMPRNPVFIKTIVTSDLAEKIASHYGVKTINVLTGFKFIGEQIGRLKDKSDYICGFEESYGYLTGSYVRDKDGVNAAFIICEMFAYYKTRGISLIEKLNELYTIYGYCLNSLYSFEFPGLSGMQKMNEIMKGFRDLTDTIAGEKILKTEDYSIGLNGLPKSNVLRFYTKNGTVIVRPSGTEPKLKIYLCVMSDKPNAAKLREKEVIDFIKSEYLN